MPEIMSDQNASDDKSSGKAGDNADSAAAALSSSAAGAGIASQGSGGSPCKEQPVEATKEKTESDSSPSDSATADDALPSATAAGIESHESEISPSKMQPVGFIKEKPESESSPSTVEPVGIDSSPSKVQQVAKEEERLRESLVAVRAKAIQNAIILMSAVVALFILTTMCLSGGQPLQVASVWYLSLLICLCSFSWVWFLKVAIGAGMVFIFITYGLLVAGVAHYACGPKIGMLCVHFVTHLAALFVGYSFAGHWLKTAEKNDIPLPTNVQQAKKLQLHFPRMFMVTITVCAAVAVVWIMYHADDYAQDELLLTVLMPLLLILILWMSYMDVSMSGAFLGQEGLAVVFAYYWLIIMMYLISLAILGPAAAALTMWIASLGMSGFFGFFLSIYNSYK